jgi:hypothetical protein
MNGRITLMNSTRYPTPEELEAMTASARRLRAQTVAGLFAAASRGLKSWFARGSKAPTARLLDGESSMHRSA